MAITVEDTVAAYRLFLGREPSEKEARAWLHVPSISILRKSFLTSLEFQQLLQADEGESDRRPQRLPLDVAPISVEWDVGPETHQRLMQYVSETWTALGKQEPHWSVLSSDVFKAVNIEHSLASFYASGASSADLVAAILARYSLKPANLSRVIEYGCGVGRVTPHLAAMFGSVVGIDISESHLALAREAIALKKTSNARVALARAPEFGMVEPFDLWFSYIVLQHNPPPIMASILRRMFSMLSPEGIAIFQLPTYVPGYRFDVQEYLAASKLGTIEVHCLPQDVVFHLASEGGCIALEVREDSAMGYPWLSNMFVFRKIR